MAKEVTTSKDLTVPTDRPKVVARRVQLSADMTEEDVKRALEVQRIAIAYGARRKAATRKNGGSK